MSSGRQARVARHPGPNRRIGCIAGRRRCPARAHGSKPPEVGLAPARHVFQNEVRRRCSHQVARWRSGVRQPQHLSLPDQRRIIAWPRCLTQTTQGQVHQVQVRQRLAGRSRCFGLPTVAARSRDSTSQLRNRPRSSFASLTPSSTSCSSASAAWRPQTGNAISTAAANNAAPGHTSSSWANRPDEDPKRPRYTNQRASG
jgi:hypothetical protein